MPYRNSLSSQLALPLLDLAVRSSHASSRLTSSRLTRASNLATLELLQPNKPALIGDENNKIECLAQLLIPLTAMN